MLVVHRKSRVDMLELISSEVVGLERCSKRNCGRIEGDGWQLIETRIIE